MKLVYVWMTFGLLTTSIVAWFTATNDALASMRGSQGIMIVSMLLLFGSVIALSAGMRARWMTANLAAFLFFLFAAIEGFSLSLLLEYFFLNEPGALYAAFGTTAALFGAMTIVGYTTSMDLTKFGTYLFMGLIGLIIAMIVNSLFIGSGGLAFMISIGGVLLFTGLTAYDTQKIKQMAEQAEYADGEMKVKLSIMGALALYLDVINLFLFLLRIFAGGRD